MFEGKSLLTVYRNELFGIATLMIVICHSVSIVPFESNLSKIISYGTMGVNIFLFLSGIGLYYSLKRNDNYIEFYKKRLIRVVVPYLFIGGIWYGVKYLVFDSGNIVRFLYELSTLSFWREHKGAWFVAAIIPIYIMYPLLFQWLESGKRIQKTSILLACMLSLAFYISQVNVTLYTHLSQILVGGVVFLVGNCIAESVKNNTFNGRYLFVIGILIFAIKTITPLKEIQMFCDMSVGMLSISVVFLFSVFFKYCGEYCRNILILIGSISLESYLFNIFLLQVVKFWANIFLHNEKFGYRLLLYIVISIIGLLLSFVSKKVIKQLFKFNLGIVKEKI